ncbi:MAG: polysaccharide deacetylase family protein [Chloroflexi bacterium]|nr:polysaccharide deacetylase family protein [Chloroflexota bacterium]
MKIKVAATIATVIVIVAGFAVISPLFLRVSNPEPKQTVMLIFSISESADAFEWSNSLSSLLKSHDMGASVFIVGKVAQEYPQIVSHFGKKVDVGSQTYSNLALTSISDYSLRLQEVKRGKTAVDNAGNLRSGIFRAPFDATDQDIYSLLSRSGILADFSYQGQYNLYENGQFVRYEAVVYQGASQAADFFLTLPKSAVPIIIVFDNTYPISSLKSFLTIMKKGDFEFVNATELAGFTLTGR